jgi:hypothetical protein
MATARGSAPPFALPSRHSPSATDCEQAATKAAACGEAASAADSSITTGGSGMRRVEHAGKCAPVPARNARRVLGPGRAIMMRTNFLALSLGIAFIAAQACGGDDESELASSGGNAGSAGSRSSRCGQRRGRRSERRGGAGIHGPAAALRGRRLADWRARRVAPETASARRRRLIATRPRACASSAWATRTARTPTIPHVT